MKIYDMTPLHDDDYYQDYFNEVSTLFARLGYHLRFINFYKFPHDIEFALNPYNPISYLVYLFWWFILLITNNMGLTREEVGDIFPFEISDKYVKYEKFKLK